MRKPLWTLLAVPNKMPFFYTLYSALECCYSFLALTCGQHPWWCFKNVLQAFKQWYKLSGYAKHQDMKFVLLVS